MKKALAILMAILMLVPAFAMGEGEKVVKIGIFEPASGDSGAGGKQETLGMYYAQKIQPTVEIGGETYKVELVFADNGSSADKGPTAAQQLVSSGASVVLGSYGSTVSMAGSPVFEAAGVPVIGVTCTNEKVTIGNTHYFRICFLDSFQGPLLASFAVNTLSAKTAYCLAELGNEYDTGLCKNFQTAFEAQGGVVISDTFPNGTSDFTTYLSNAVALGADVFFAPCSGAYFTQMINQASTQNVGFPMLGGDTWDQNKVVEVAQGTNLKIYVSTFYQEGGNPEFDAGFKAYLNGDAEALTNNGGNDIISAVSAMGYDAYFVALEALKLAGSTDPKAVNEALWKIDYTGVSGKITFNEIGDANRDSAFFKTVNTANNCWDFVAEQGVQ